MKLLFDIIKGHYAIKKADGYSFTLKMYGYIFAIVSIFEDNEWYYNVEMLDENGWNIEDNIITNMQSVFEVYKIIKQFIINY